MDIVVLYLRRWSPGMVAVVCFCCVFLKVLYNNAKNGRFRRHVGTTAAPVAL